MELDWEAFRTRLLGYVRQPPARRQQLMFRGQHNAKWNLQTTLDREFQFASPTDRSRTNHRLLHEFRCELLLLNDQLELVEDALELLGRHHGLPSPLMDWTNSPYVAAYFAFASAARDVDHVTVWVLDRAADIVEHPHVRILDDTQLLRFNPRAKQQRGLFLRAEVDTREQPIERLLSGAVHRYDLPVTDRRLAMTDLDEMGINATSLFGDYDGAARTAFARIRGEVTQ